MTRHNLGRRLLVAGILLSAWSPVSGENSTPPAATDKSIEQPKSESTAATKEPSKTEAATTAEPTKTEQITPEPAKTESTPAAPSALPSNWVPVKATPEKPAAKPAPAGQAAAVKLFSERKYAAAAAQFDKFIKDGSANSDTHEYMAYCEYNQRHYTKALNQFDWVAKWTPDNYKLRTSAERAGSMLRGQMAGICPQPCLKPNDPRWQRVGDHREIHWNITNGWTGVTDHHMGQLISVKNDQIVNGGVCPTCGGTGRVTPLRDGDAIPR